MPVKYEVIDTLLGELVLLPTDIDKSTTGFLNRRIYELEFWQQRFGSLDNMPVIDLARRMNSILTHLGTSKRMSDFTNSHDALKELLKQTDYLAG
jgi:hypothetical protein